MQSVKECNACTYSRLQLRQGGLKLWSDQLKWLIFDVKMFIHAVENRTPIRQRPKEVCSAVMLPNTLRFYLSTWGKVSVDRLKNETSRREVKSLGFSSPSWKYCVSCSDKQPMCGNMV